jgi:hypothetical protein
LKVATEDVHARLFALARDVRPWLGDLLDRLEDIEMAGGALPEEAHDLARAASRFLQHYVQPPPDPPEA